MKRRTFMKLALGSGLLPLFTGIGNSRWNGWRAIYYWNLHSPPEGLEGAVRTIEELDARFIWYAHWMVGFPMPPDLEQAKEIATKCGLNGKEAEKFVNWCRAEFYTLEFVKEQTNAVRGRTYCPTILGYTNFRRDFNFDPITFEPIAGDEIESMLLDLGKWDITNPDTGKPFTIEETQKLFWDSGLPRHNGIPDYSDPKVVKHYIRRAKAFKKAGAQAVWFDLFFQLPLNLKKRLNLDFDHPMIKDLYDGCSKIINGAKLMGLTVGTWFHCFEFPYKRPNLDFVTASPTTEEVLSLTIDYERWNRLSDLVNGTDLLIIFDFANRDDLPLPVFSQKLSPQQQCEFLLKLHDLVSEIDAPATVAYPIHGPGLGEHPKRLAWNEFKLYDAKAFGTYKTILSLMKSQQPKSPFMPSYLSILILLALASKKIKRDRISQAKRNSLSSS